MLTKSIHILLIDGNNISQRSLVNGLSVECDVTVIDNDHLAEINIKRSHFDVVLINYDSLKDDALKIAMTIRRECPLEPYTSIVLLSSFMNDEFIHRAVQHGMNLCLPRACNANQLRLLLLEQIRSPVCQLSFRHTCTCNCLIWNYGNKYFQYSPDLQETVSADSAEEAERLMQELLKAERVTLAQAQFGQAQVDIVQHRIDIKDLSATRLVRKDEGQT